MNRQLTRLQLLRDGDDPAELKIEIYSNVVLLFGLTDKKGDYWVFKTLDNAVDFLKLNYNI